MTHAVVRPGNLRRVIGLACYPVKRPKIFLSCACDNSRMRYLHLSASAPLPEIDALRPFKAVLILEQPLEEARREAICDWLVAAGCLYLMAWGVDCERWDAVIQKASRTPFAPREIPDEYVLISTTHAGENLTDALWFARHTAMHPCSELDQLLLLHIADRAREGELTEAYERA